MRNPKIFTLVVTVMLVIISCDDSETKLRVMAASSLTEAFNDMAEIFERQNPNINVQVQFAGSQRLRYQLEFGAKADIFASADHKQMAPLLIADLVTGSTSEFAANSLVLIASDGSPVGHITDLAAPGVTVVLAQSNVPAGEYSRQVLQNLSQKDRSFKGKVLSNLVSEESNVRNVAQKVALGEVDSGIVYKTDVTGARLEGNITVIEFPEESNIIARYPIAVLKNSSQKDLAKEFLDFVMSEIGQSILAKRGFSSP